MKYCVNMFQTVFTNYLLFENCLRNATKKKKIKLELSKLAVVYQYNIFHSCQLVRVSKITNVSLKQHFQEMDLLPTLLKV